MKQRLTLGKNGEHGSPGCLISSTWQGGASQLDTEKPTLRQPGKAAEETGEGRAHGCMYWEGEKAKEGAA